MREIKFRGKRLDNGEWLYGSLVILNGRYFIFDDANRHEVDPTTVGEFTGLKDKNGKEQWYSYTEYPTNESKNGVRRLIFNEHTRFDSFVDVPSGYYRKATVEEIVEYFKNNEK